MFGRVLRLLFRPLLLRASPISLPFLILCGRPLCHQTIMWLTLKGILIMARIAMVVCGLLLICPIFLHRCFIVLLRLGISASLVPPIVKELGLEVTSSSPSHYLLAKTSPKFLLMIGGLLVLLSWLLPLTVFHLIGTRLRDHHRFVPTEVLLDGKQHTSAGHPLVLLSPLKDFTSSAITLCGAT